MRRFQWFWLQGKPQRYSLVNIFFLIFLYNCSESGKPRSTTTSQLDTRRILKRLAKENLKQLGRMVAKLAHANPLTVLRTILHQVLFELATCK